MKENLLIKPGKKFFLEKKLRKIDYSSREGIAGEGQFSLYTL